MVDSVSDGDNWSASFSGDGTWWYASIVSDSGGGNRLHALESVVATITFNDTGVDGTFSWTGNAYNKEDCTDDFGMPRVVSVTIDGAVVDNPPVAQPDAYGTGRNAPLNVGAPGVLSNDTDPDGDPLTATQTSGPANGGLIWGADGSFTYTPDPGFVGTDAFSYHANDASASSADTTVTITVTNGAPVPVDDVYSIAWSQPLVVGAPGILGNDTDPDGDALTASVVSGPSNGILLPNANGSFTYVPNLLFIGTDSFTYAASDGLDTGQATVFINVANAAPVAAADGPYATRGGHDAQRSGSRRARERHRWRWRCAHRHPCRRCQRRQRHAPARWLLRLRPRSGLRRRRCLHVPGLRRARHLGDDHRLDRRRSGRRPARRQRPMPT